MKYNIIAGLFIFLFLACNPDFNTNQKDMRYQSSKKGLKSNKKKLKPNSETTPNQEAPSNQKEDDVKKTKNTLIDDLRNLIEKAHSDNEKYKKKVDTVETQYGMLEAFKILIWDYSSSEKLCENTERSRRYRRRIYSILNTINDNELKNFSEIIEKSGHLQGIFNDLSTFGEIFDHTIDFLYPKKDTLEKLEIPNLEKLKNLFEQLLSTKTTVSEMMYKLLLDYQNDENDIKKDINKLKSHISELYNQTSKKRIEAKKLENDIYSMYQ
ncbi:virulence associated lipoprotein (plasmid) [Borrelia sp. CA_690]|uniref:Lipoprotein P35 n=1 Tax=Borrelia maritima TaxID=2761123 RepID=A0A5J6WE06_9SPIR|nr:MULTISPECIES: virulence associated lipoprotein [Borrelia]QFI15075.1 lipoprotein P35 [Borrelia maritima]WKC83944.1 virulence associated lipoprotein [Borrelia sp. CA_690]